MKIFKLSLLSLLLFIVSCNKRSNCESEIQLFHENGKLGKILRYNSTCKLNGLQETWFKDGSKQSEKTFLNGDLHGVSISYSAFKDGHKFVSNYNHGKKEGDFIWFGSNADTIKHEVYHENYLIKTIKKPNY